MGSVNLKAKGCLVFLAGLILPVPICAIIGYLLFPDDDRAAFGLLVGFIISCVIIAKGSRLFEQGKKKNQKPVTEASVPAKETVQLSVSVDDLDQYVIDDEKDGYIPRIIDLVKQSVENNEFTDSGYRNIFEHDPQELGALNLVPINNRSEVPLFWKVPLDGSDAYVVVSTRKLFYSDCDRKPRYLSLNGNIDVLIIDKVLSKDVIIFNKVEVGRFTESDINRNFKVLVDFLKSVKDVLADHKKHIRKMEQEKNRIEKEIEIAQKKQQELLYKKKITDKYGDEVADLIFNKKIKQGMSKEALIESWGKPEDIKQTIFKTKTKERYFYDGSLTNRGTVKYATEVLLEGDVVAGWKEH